jgi:hypothetical protein
VVASGAALIYYGRRGKKDLPETPSSETSFTVSNPGPDPAPEPAPESAPQKSPKSKRRRRKPKSAADVESKIPKVSPSIRSTLPKGD